MAACIHSQKYVIFRTLANIQSAYDSHMEHGFVLPVSITKENHLRQLLFSKHTAGTLKYLGQARLNKEKEWVIKRGKAATSSARIAAHRKGIEENNHIVYGIGRNSIFHRIYDADIDRQLNWKVWIESGFKSNFKTRHISLSSIRPSENTMIGAAVSSSTSP